MRIDVPTPPASADGAGALVLSFSAVPAGHSWIVSVTVPTAPQTAVGGVYLTGLRRLPVLGDQPSAVVEATDGQVVSYQGTGFTPGQRYRAFATGAVVPGAPRGVAPAGPGTLTLATINAPVSITQPVSVTVEASPPPVVATVGVFTGHVALAGTATAVPIIPSTRTPTYWENLRIGWSVWSTPKNTGTSIFIGDATGGTPAGWARIPSGKGNLMGAFSVDWGNAWVVRVAGKLGDYLNVWAA
ncbi:MAG: hypothetical protein M0010_15355 [Actinomycetota bacterium]|jgi:hypothetical protein|nr:hypothetical protein [Actinomycetota bacterium]